MPPPDGPVSLLAADWDFYLTDGSGAVITDNDTPPGWYFDWPDHEIGVGYVVSEYPFDISGLTSISVDVTMTKDMGASYAFDGPNDDNPCLTAPNFGFLLVRYAPYLDRWWSNVRTTLGEGDETVTMDLTDLSTWVNVNGQLANSSPAATESFTKTLEQLLYVGLTFGGGCFYSHGAFVEGGSASFSVTDITIS